jgi:inorganic triphosphatase YgiF
MRPADSGLEIELKFQVPPARRAALARAIGTATAEHIELRARYYDTPDGRLAAAQLALRLRREGDGWVQTLKGRGDGLMQRLEHEVPCPPEAGDPPALDLARHKGTAAGRALTAALAGAEAPTVRYGTEIQRLKRMLRHRGARIEVALDVGLVIAGEARAPVCEVEFELLSGPLPALLDLAGRWADRFGLLPDPATKSERAQWLAQGLAAPPAARAQAVAPAPGLPLGEARAAMVASTLAQALPNAGAVTAGSFGPDHVHQLRVALRRLRSVLRAFGPADAARDEALAALFGALGGSRDADVLALTLAPAWAAAQAAGLAVPAGASPEIDPAGPQALCAPGVTRWWLGLVALTAPDSAEAAEAAEAAPWDALALARLRRWHRQARRDAAAWPDLPDEGRHSLRKRLKRLRYLLEFCAALLPARALARESAALRALQETLGHWNDIVVARAWLAAQGLDQPAQAFAAGWLAHEARVADAACARAARTWRRLDGVALKTRRRKARRK